MEYKNNPARGVYRQEEGQPTFSEVRNSTSINFIDKLNLKDSSAIKKNLVQTAVIIGLSLIVFAVNLYLRKHIIDIENSYNISSLLIISMIIGVMLWCLYNILIAPIILFKRCTLSSVAKCIGYEDTAFAMSHHSGIVKTAAIFEHNYEGKTYTIYNANYVKNEQTLPSINQIVPIRFNEKNPYICVINNERPLPKNKIIVVTILFFTLIPFLLSPDVSSNKMILDNRTLEDEFPDTDYIVYERTITSVSGNTYYFAPAGGVQNFATTDVLSGCDAGDKVYWIQSADGYSIMYPKARYEYRGDKTYENNSMVSDNGKFLLTPEYLMDQLQTSTVTVYDATVTNIGVNSIDFSVSNNRTLHLEYNDLDVSAMGLSVGEKVYYVSWDYKGIFYSQKYNSYAGPLQ